MNWRDSKLFTFGYLPLRIVFAGIAFVAAAVYTAAIYLMWFQPWMAKQAWRGTR